MQNSLWKLTALAGVVGIGFLAVLQAQRGLVRPGDEQIAEVLKEAELPSVGDATASAAMPGHDGSATLASRGTAAAGAAKASDAHFEPPEFEPVSRRAPAAGDALFSEGSSRSDEPEPWDGSPAPDPRSRATGTTSAPAPRGLDFRTPPSSSNDDATMPVATREARETDSDPFDQGEPSPGPSLGASERMAPAPRASSPVRLAGNEESSADPFAAPPAGDKSLRTADLIEPAGDPEGDRSDFASESIESPPEPGPQLVVPTAAADDASSPFGDDLPSLPAPRSVPKSRAPYEASTGTGDVPEPRDDGPRDNGPSANDFSAASPGAFPDLPFDGSFPTDEPKSNEDPKPTVAPTDRPTEGRLESPRPRRGRELPTSPQVAEPDLDFDAPANEAPPLRPLPDARATRGAPRDDRPEPPTSLDRPPALLPVDPDESPMRSPRARRDIPAFDPRAEIDAPPRRDVRDERRDMPRPASPLVPVNNPDADDVVGDGTLDAGTPKGPQRPQLKIEKQAPQNATLGQPMVYNILIKNVGETAAQDVVVEDRVPRGTQLSGTNPQAELVDKTLVWKLGTMQPGEERKIGVRVVPVSEGQIGSIATVNFVAEVGARTLITAPKLQLDLMLPKQVRQGEPVPVTFRLRNTGNADATGVVIRNLVPEGLRHPDGNDLEYDLGTLAAGAMRDVKLTLSAVKAGDATNKAIATADGGVSAEASSAVEIVGPSLSVVRTGPRKTWLGRTAQYSTTVTNDSETLVPTATVVETVPAGMEILEAPNAHISADRRTLSWRIDRLGPHQSAELKVKLLPKTTGVKSSTVKVSEGPGLPHEVTTETEVAGAAQLDSDLSGGDGLLGVGDKATYKVVVRNRGNEAAANVKLTLGLPAEVEYVSSDVRAESTRDGRELSLPVIPRLEPGREAVYQVILRASRDGDARLTLTTDADDLRSPLVKEEQVVILADESPSSVSPPRRR